MNEVIQHVPLGELGSLGRGRSRHRPRYAPHLYGGEYPFIQTGDIKSSEGKITSFSQTYSEAGLEQSRLWDTGTLCITIAANIAETAILTFPTCFPDSVVGFIGKEELVDNRYIEYTFRHLRALIQNDASGSVQDNINLEYLRQLPIPIWTLNRQKVIAHILGILDDKIELNQKMNETLEEIAKAIFKSWFVDFDPVREKMEGRPTGLTDDISDLFPNELVDSEIGEIPKGWEIKIGSEVYTHQKGLSYKGKFLSDEKSDFPMLNLGSFLGGGRYRQKKIKFYKGEHKEKHQIVPGDLLLANTDLTQDRIVIGSPILVPSIPNDHPYFLFTHHTTKITPKENSPIDNIYLYYNFIQSTFRDRVSGYATGTTVLALPKDTFDNLEILIPPSGLLNSFKTIADPIIEKRSISTNEIGTLSDLRDTLLPKLISGELQIPDAEKFLEEAGI